ncbi:hypothetical protein [Stenotrophomonas maltophilia]|uniref:Uncharacterized protein n=1 Tax=Stenotrophomonas maltophilia TaxID=40324 RepID=A0AAI9BXX4_STEMA|nr:hypothetical protein [Stenotrophomonas maltophilia]EKT4091682.1 hypothetical protein [Stenotrophomonas maltophilia]HEL5044603.1 hypothetical protein [Stenotrophomonas maltophilia]
MAPPLNLLYLSRGWTGSCPAFFVAPRQSIQAKTGLSKDGFSQLFPKAMTGILPVLREMFPGKAMLTVEDVARVLNRTGAGGYEQTRDQLSRGLIVPGLRKFGGSWLVPITTLAAALDGLVETDGTGRSTPKALPATHTVISAEPLVPRRAGRMPTRAKQRLELQQTRASQFWPLVLSTLRGWELDAALPPPAAPLPRNPF